MGILEKISEIEKEIARTQKNKGRKRMCASFLLFKTLNSAHHVHPSVLVSIQPPSIIWAC